LINLNEKPTNDTGIVVDIQDDFAFVEVAKGEICNTCKLSSLCFHNGNKKTIFRIRNTLNVERGNKISFLIEPQVRILSSFLIYVMPLLFLIGAYLICKFLLHLSENWSIIGSILSFFFSYFILNFIDKIFTRKNLLNPKMINILK